MTRVLTAALLGFLSAPAAPDQLKDKPIGEIEFFGYRGLSVDSLRAGMPIRERDPFPAADAGREELRAKIVDRVRETLGHAPTDVRFTCCDDRDEWMVFVGLAGTSYRPLRYNPAPTGAERLPPALLKLQDEADEALQRAILGGRSAEDDSQGFALSEDPDVRAKQMALREYALLHEAELLSVLTLSAEARHRAIAAGALGYARRSQRQLSALVDASLDADDGVRNDAVRALAVLAGSDRDLASCIPATTFVALLASGIWTDHNKGAAVLEAISRARDPKLLLTLRSEALDNLIEMARWRSSGHAATARILLARIAGIEESRVYELAAQGRVEEIIAALDASPVPPER